jgi:heme exporter protein A
VIHSVEVEDLAVVRGERRLFARLSFRLQAGRATALTGPNGAGKTSLLRAVAGPLRPSAGRIGFAGEAGPVEAAEARRSGLHLLGHLDGLRPGRTVGEELAFQAGWLSASRLDEAIETFQLRPLLGLETRKLSAGQRRRAALARLVAAPRPLWLLDEPLAPLDARWREAAAGLMRDHLANGGMILAAAHDPLPVAAEPLSLGEAA